MKDAIARKGPWGQCVRTSSRSRRTVSSTNDSELLLRAEFENFNKSCIVRQTHTPTYITDNNNGHHEGEGGSTKFRHDSVCNWLSLLVV
jgi:hypothetical protein